MAAGITLAQHYVTEALRLFEASRVSDDLRLAQKLLTWLLVSWSENFVSLPDIYQKGPNAIRDKNNRCKARRHPRRPWLAQSGKVGCRDSGPAPPRRLADHGARIAMTAFKKFDPHAFLERERLAPDSTESLAALATLAGPPLENEICTTPSPMSQGDYGVSAAKSIELQRDHHTFIHRLDQLSKNQNLTPTPAKVAKVAKDDNNFSNFSSPAPSKTQHNASPYASALTALRASCPAFIPEDRWHQAVADATAFVSEWGAEAEAFGWTVPELFGLHPVPEQPAANYSRLSRLDEMGVIWLLHRRPVVALTETTAAIQGATAVLTYRKINKPALGPVGDSLDDWGAS